MRTIEITINGIAEEYLERFRRETGLKLDEKDEDTIKTELIDMLQDRAIKPMSLDELRALHGVKSYKNENKNLPYPTLLLTKDI